MTSTSMNSMSVPMTSMSPSLSRRVGRLAVLAMLSLVAVLLVAGPARANLQISDVGVSLDRPPVIDDKGTADPSDDFPAVNSDGTFVDPAFERQAGSHPDLSVAITFPQDANHVPLEAAKDVEVDLPNGMVGNPNAIPTCAPQDLLNTGAGSSKCPMSSQIGIAEVDTAGPGGSTQLFRVGVFNISHGPDVPAKFGFNLRNVIGLVTARVRPGDYGISSGSFSISEGYGLKFVRLTFWGVPADASHDWLRQGTGVDLGNVVFNTPTSTRRPATEAPAPFLTLPPTCPDKPLAFTIRGDSWEHPGVFDTKTISADEDGVPFVMEGCDRVPFKPTATVKPLAHVADGPTGLDVDVNVPQPNDPDGIATADVRKVKMTFPQGVSVSPSSAAGLGACAPTQIGLGTNDPPTCPASSTIGTVTIDTPLLADPLEGDMILATQNNNPFRSLVALYIAAKGPGFYLKLPGKVDLDPTTGQVTATFDNTPQLPFSHMQVHFNGGSQAALASPMQCGTFYTHIEISSWVSGTAPVSSDSPMTINQNCGPKPFTPSYSAGTTNPLAGQHTAFGMTLTRTDGMPYLSQINMVMPAGLLADIASVPQCDPTPANAGFCPAESKIGTTSTLSGPGALPLALTGNVYLTGPYKDAPFGLSIAVPTAGQAGPFDLGVVVVRAALYVDRNDAHVTVKSDPLPTIIQGIPLRLRQVNVTIDRPNFMINPTNCAAKSIFTTIAALGGGSSDQAVAFRAGGCGDLDLKPTLKLKIVGKKSHKDGTYPGVDATLTDPGGGSNYSKVETKLPLALVLEPKHAQALCKPEQAAAYNCPKTSIVGTAKAKSVLPHDMTGPVYFVEGRRKTNTGRTVASLPDLWIPLSADGVTIDVRASSQVDPKTDRLITTFHDLPDAPIKSFNLKINGGKHGILVVSGKSTCDRDMSFDMRYTGQTGEVKVANTDSSVDGCKAAVKSSRTSNKSVAVKVGNISAGKLTVTGGGLLARATKKVAEGPSVWVTARLTSKARAALQRHGKVSVKVSVAYKPKKGKTVKLSKKVTVRR